jgi:hypothetical protein
MLHQAVPLGTNDLSTSNDDHFPILSTLHFLHSGRLLVPENLSDVGEDDVVLLFVLEESEKVGLASGLEVKGRFGAEGGGFGSGLEGVGFGRGVGWVSDLGNAVLR